jgi:hypothetical protein
MGTSFRGVPGVYAGKAITPRNIFTSNNAAIQVVPSLTIIDGTASRDLGNTPASLLRAGLILGKITSTGKFANSIIGLTGEALDADETALTVSAAVAAELSRRIGASGTFKITGPPTTGGTVRTLTATYSGISGTTVTITALGVNEVQRVNFNIASTGGNVILGITDPTTGSVVRATAAWSATDATYLGNINTALDLATGVAGGIVATAIAATDTDLGFTLTFSGTGYAAKAHPLVEILGYPTSSTQGTVTRVTAGVDGRMADKALIQPTDGSETPLTVLDVEYGVDVNDLDGNALDQPLSRYLRGADLIATSIINLTEGDASCQAWLKAQLKAAGYFTFDNDRR